MLLFLAIPLGRTKSTIACYVREWGSQGTIGAYRSSDIHQRGCLHVVTVYSLSGRCSSSIQQAPISILPRNKICREIKGAINILIPKQRPKTREGRQNRWPVQHFLSHFVSRQRNKTHGLIISFSNPSKKQTKTPNKQRWRTYKTQTTIALLHLAVMTSIVWQSRCWILPLRRRQVRQLLLAVRRLLLAVENTTRTTAAKLCHGSVLVW